MILYFCQTFSRMVLILIFVLLFATQTMANGTSSVHERLLRDLSKDEIKRVVKMTRQFISTGDKFRLLNFLHKLQRIVYKRRLAKCVKIFASENICQNNANFYIWARKLAKEIMNGASIWSLALIERQFRIHVRFSVTHLEVRVYSFLLWYYNIII